MKIAEIEELSETDKKILSLLAEARNIFFLTVKTKMSYNYIYMKVRIFIEMGYVKKITTLGNKTLYKLSNEVEL